MGFADLEVTQLTRDAAGALSHFSVDSEAHCSPKLDDVPVCGCVRFVK
jgi:hypothetical protein